MSKVLLVNFKRETGIEVTKDQLVNVKDLYEKLFKQRFENDLSTKNVDKSKKYKADHIHFQRWLSDNLTEVKCEDIDEYFYKENEDYIKAIVKTGKRGKPRTDYYVKQQIAELIISRSNTTLGRTILNKLLDLFHNLESYKSNRYTTVTNFKPMTDAIKAAKGPDDKFYHYTNEADMLNKLVTGLSAKQYKEKYGVDNVRDNLTPNQIKLLDDLQIMNTALIKLDFDLKARKIILTAHKEGNTQNVLQSQVLQLPVSTKAS